MRNKQTKKLIGWFVAALAGQLIGDLIIRWLHERRRTRPTIDEEEFFEDWDDDPGDEEFEAEEWLMEGVVETLADEYDRGYADGLRGVPYDGSNEVAKVFQSRIIEK